MADSTLNLTNSTGLLLHLFWQFSTLPYTSGHILVFTVCWGTEKYVAILPSLSVTSEVVGLPWVHGFTDFPKVKSCKKIQQKISCVYTKSYQLHEIAPAFVLSTQDSPQHIRTHFRVHCMLRHRKVCSYFTISFCQIRTCRLAMSAWFQWTWLS